MATGAKPPLTRRPEPSPTLIAAGLQALKRNEQRHFYQLLLLLDRIR
jgi:hypothetical protein